MISVLSKPAGEISAADIAELVNSRVPEGERIEFKRELSRPAGAGSWAAGQKIAKEAKNQILKEVVAFANAFGGALVLGIDEDRSSTPPVAGSIVPIPKCEELANRFRNVFRDGVDPQLPSIEIFSVPISGAEEGVVVFRTTRSRLAPHRVKGTLICPIRRWDRSEAMSMREIQDMTLNVTRGLKRVRKKFEERADSFKREFKRLASPSDAYGMRITAIPAGGDIRLLTLCRPHMQLVEGLRIPKYTVVRQLQGQDPMIVSGLEAVPGVHVAGRQNWKPRLRAVRSDQYSDGPLPSYNTYLELHCDGLVEFGWLTMLFDQDKTLYSEYALRGLATVVCWADTLRRFAGVAGVEYAVQVTVSVTGERVLVLPGSYRRSGASRIIGTALAGELPNGVHPMPKYSFSELSDARALLAILEHDLCNAGGHAIAPTTLGEVDLEYEPH